MSIPPRFSFTSSGTGSYQQPTSTTTGDVPCCSGSLQTGANQIDSTSGQQCSICNDKATGKHYNAVSCDGCKGFFRRSVRKNQHYSCRYSRTCVVDKEKRNHCRYCRLKKCFRVGMRKDAVQNERDRISTRRFCGGDTDTSLLSVQTLLRAELLSRQLDPTWTGSRETSIEDRLAASHEDICSSMRQQLLILVEWAKCIPPFLQLSLDSQIALLRAHGAEHLLLGASWRSLHLSGYVLIGDRYIVTRTSADAAISKIGGRLIDEVIAPLQQLQIDETEYATLKAAVFFDPGACRYNGEHCQRVEMFRYQIQLNLEDYVNDRQYNRRGRFGSLLLVLPSLHSIARELVEQVQLLKMLGAAKVDTLLVEMLLGETSCEETLSTSAKQSERSITQSDSQSISLHSGSEDGVGSSMTPSVSSHAFICNQFEGPVNAIEIMGSTISSDNSEFNLAPPFVSRSDVRSQLLAATNSSKLRQPESEAPVSPSYFCRTMEDATVSPPIALNRDPEQSDSSYQLQQ